MLLSQVTSFVGTSPLAGAAAAFFRVLSFLSGTALLCTEEILMPAWIISKTPSVREVRNYQLWLTSLLKGGEDTLGSPPAPPPRLRGRTPADPEDPTVNGRNSTTRSDTKAPSTGQPVTLLRCRRSGATRQQRSREGLGATKGQPARLGEGSTARGDRPGGTLSPSHCTQWPRLRWQLWFKITSLKK